MPHVVTCRLLNQGGAEVLPERECSHETLQPSQRPGSHRDLPQHPRPCTLHRTALHGQWRSEELPESKTRRSDISEPATKRAHSGALVADLPPDLLWDGLSG